MKSIRGICSGACALRAVLSACVTPVAPSVPGIAGAVQGAAAPHTGCVLAMGESQVRMGLAWPPALGSSASRARGSPPLLHLSHGLCTVESSSGSSWEARIEMWHFSIHRNGLGERGERSFHKLLSNGEEQALFWGMCWVGRGMAECTGFQIFLLFSCVCMGGRKFEPIWAAEGNQ